MSRALLQAQQCALAKPRHHLPLAAVRSAKEQQIAEKRLHVLQLRPGGLDQHEPPDARRRPRDAPAARAAALRVAAAIKVAAADARLAPELGQDRRLEPLEPWPADRQRREHRLRRHAAPEIPGGVAGEHRRVAQQQPRRPPRARNEELVPRRERREIPVLAARRPALGHPVQHDERRAVVRGEMEALVLRVVRRRERLHRVRQQQQRRVRVQRARVCLRGPVARCYLLEHLCVAWPARSAAGAMHDGTGCGTLRQQTQLRAVFDRHPQVHLVVRDQPPAVAEQEDGQTSRRRHRRRDELERVLESECWQHQARRRQQAGADHAVAGGAAHRRGVRDERGGVAGRGRGRRHRRVDR